MASFAAPTWTPEPEPEPPIDTDVPTGSEVEWDSQGRPAFLVFYASGRVDRFVDDALAWQAVALLGQHAPRHGVHALGGRRGTDPRDSRAESGAPAAGDEQRMHPPRDPEPS